MRRSVLFSLTSLLLTNYVSAATRVDLNQQSFLKIKPYFAKQMGIASLQSSLKTVSTRLDQNQTAHVHLQQMYAGVPVWNATSVVHIPNAKNQRRLMENLTDKTKMNGVLYEGIDADLAATPNDALSDAQKEKALQEAKTAFEQKMGTNHLNYKKESNKTIVYLDENNKAHYAFLVSFYYDDGKTGAHRPTAIIDAVTLTPYHVWDMVMTENSMEISDALIGGVGGNEKVGEITYDGSPENLPGIQGKSFDYQMKQGGAIVSMTYCTLMNDRVSVYDMSYGEIVSSPCDNNTFHNNMSWISIDYQNTRWKGDQVNGGYSPSLDAFYNATIVDQFYQAWYGVPALVQEDGRTPMKLNMRVHYGRNYDNAFWDGEQMTFGDGGSYFYPMTSLGVTAHEISHGFTSQHSDINGYEPQMAALHEAFSDEAAVAMQYYTTGKATWDIGRDITKTEGALRYLDNPKKDGHSIDNIQDFDATEAHAGAGVFNKAFYLIATSKGWDVRKAFNVMVGANMNYWTSSMSTMAEAACGVLSATQDYDYNSHDVSIAFLKVGIDTSSC